MPETTQQMQSEHATVADKEYRKRVAGALREAATLIEFGEAEPTSYGFLRYDEFDSYTATWLRKAQPPSRIEKPVTEPQRETVTERETR